MRRTLLVVALAGCASHARPGPAWPKASQSDTDGGESIEPRVVRPVEAAADKTDEEETKPAPAAPAAAPATPAPAKEVVAPAVGAPAAPTVEESITTEDIVIEIDD